MARAAKANATSKADAPADPDKLVRQQAGTYRSGDERFEIREADVGWFLVDSEQTNEFGQELIQGPFPDAQSRPRGATSCPHRKGCRCHARPEEGGEAVEGGEARRAPQASRAELDRSAPEARGRRRAQADRRPRARRHHRCRGARPPRPRGVASRSRHPSHRAAARGARRRPARWRAEGRPRPGAPRGRGAQLARAPPAATRCRAGRWSRSTPNRSRRIGGST